jgi:hypothetical protein
MKENIDIQENRKLEGDRLELYNLFRKKHPKGKKESQVQMCLQIADERIKVYKDIFKDKEK